MRWGFLLAALLLLAAPLFARSWKIARFDARYTVADDGAVLIEEEIHPSFEGTYNGIDCATFRSSIPAPTERPTNSF